MVSLEKLAELAEAIAGSLQLSEVLDRVARAATELLPGSAARIWVVERSILVLRAEAGTEGLPQRGDKTALAFGEGWAGHVATTQQPLIVEDIASDARLVNRQWMAEHGYASSVAIPLIIRGNLVGVLVFMTRARHHFTAVEVTTLKGFGTHAAIAIHSAQLYAEAQHGRRAAEALADVGRVVSQPLRLDEAAERIVNSVARLFGAAASVLYQWEPDLDKLVALAVAGEWGPALDHVMSPTKTAIMALAVRQRESVATTDWLSDPRLALPADVRARLEEGPARAVLAVPLLVQDCVIGVLGISRRLGGEFDGADLRLAQAFGDQAAIALDNARRFEEQRALLDVIRSRRTRLEALVEMTREVSNIESLDSLLRHVAETCGRLLQTDSVGIRLLEGGELVVAFASGGAKEVMATRRLKLGDSISGIAATTGQPLVLNDAVNDPRLLPAHRETMKRLGYRGLLAVPIRVVDRVAGVLSIQKRAGVFSGDDVEIVTAFASQVGVALHNNQLYQQAQEAYQELKKTQNQLLQSQKMDALGRLAGGVAHDFNNLLTVILGQTHLLLRRVESQDVTDGLERVRLTVERASELTRRLLAFSRKQVLQPKVLQLNSVLHEVVPMLQRIIGDDVELRTVLDSTVPPVKADASQLEQVIINLAVNARDAMPLGGQLTLETSVASLDAAYTSQHPEVAPGPYVLLAVTDTGIGMDAEIRSRIFEPFFTTKEPGKGTGLGLSMVYGIVKQSGGHISVYSEPGRGTTFKIYLPVVAERVDSARPTTPAASPRGSETILLVEDEPAVRELVKQILEDNGYTVVESSQPGDALEVAGQPGAAFDLLVTDVVMPQMSGPVLAKVLTADHPGLAVLFMSGYTEHAVIRQGVLPAGAIFLQKPFTPDQLARAVRGILDRTRQPAVAAR
jgi:signal transduction histidine kinase/ActR/RegA family two-component response regulator